MGNLGQLFDAHSNLWTNPGFQFSHGQRVIPKWVFLTCLNLALFSEPVGFTDNVLKEVHVEKQLKKSTADASSGSFGPVGSSHAGGGFISPTGSCH